jgi:hypothetical protein
MATIEEDPEKILTNPFAFSYGSKIYDKYANDREIQLFCGPSITYKNSESVFGNIGDKEKYNLKSYWTYANYISKIFDDNIKLPDDVVKGLYPGLGVYCLDEKGNRFKTNSYADFRTKKDVDGTRKSYCKERFKNLAFYIAFSNSMNVISGDQTIVTALFGWDRTGCSVRVFFKECLTNFHPKNIFADEAYSFFAKDMRINDKKDEPYYGEPRIAFKQYPEPKDYKKKTQRRSSHNPKSTNKPQKKTQRRSSHNPKSTPRTF